MATVKKRIIVVNPEFMRTAGSRRIGLKQKSVGKNKVSTHELKRKLIDKIRQHRQREALRAADLESHHAETKKSTEFTESLTYLDRLAKQKRPKGRKRLTIDHRRTLIPIIGVDNVPYGNLKNGKKQTYRQYMRSQKSAPPKIQIEDFPHPRSEHSERKERLQMMKDSPNIGYKTIVDEQSDKIKTLESQLASYTSLVDSLPKLLEQKPIEQPIAHPRQVRRPLKRLRRTVRRKLGKRGGRMGVLVKNAQTRKRIQREANLLKDAPMMEVRSYLKKHSLFKIGSAAPDSVLRRTYENAVLSGDIHNKNKEVLVHNYMTDDVDDPSS